VGGDPCGEPLQPTSPATTNALTITVNGFTNETLLWISPVSAPARPALASSAPQRMGRSRPCSRWDRLSRSRLAETTSVTSSSGPRGRGGRRSSPGRIASGYCSLLDSSPSMRLIPNGRYVFEKYSTTAVTASPRPTRYVHPSQTFSPCRGSDP
jgi:hypothetical protein